MNNKTHERIMQRKIKRRKNIIRGEKEVRNLCAVYYVYGMYVCTNVLARKTKYIKERNKTDMEMVIYSIKQESNRTKIRNKES